MEKTFIRIFDELIAGKRKPRKASLDNMYIMELVYGNMEQY